MRLSSRNVVVLLALTLLLPSTLVAAESANQMILTAGNVEDDGQRLEILKRLQAATDVDPLLRREVDQMVTLVDRWLHEPSLYRWFDREIRRTVGYDFKIRPESPLYPLARLYYND